MKEEIKCSAQQYIPQWQERIGWRLFPHNYVEWPEMNEHKDGFYCGITVTLSMLDRIRALVSGKIEVTAKTVCENEIGKHITTTGASVRPPKFLDRI